MKQERRQFLQQMAAMCGAGVARQLGVGLGAGAVAIAATEATTTAVKAVALAKTAGGYGAGVRGQVFEVIVRQALAGAPWETVCEGPMRVNRITPEEVLAEMRRRIAAGAAHPPKRCYCEKCVAERRKRHALADEKVANLPHSAVSPCPCKDCRTEVSQIISELVTRTLDLEHQPECDRTV